jgi:hypothetical protein
VVVVTAEGSRMYDQAINGLPSHGKVSKYCVTVSLQQQSHTTAAHTDDIVHAHDRQVECTREPQPAQAFF